MDSQIDLYRPLPETSPQALEAMCTDCARKIHDGETLAERYNFRDKDHLKNWLLDHPAVYRKIKEIQAVWDSSVNIDVKARTLAGYAAVEVIPAITQIALNPDVAPGLRNDSFKEIARVAGVGGPPPVPREGGGGNASGAPFSVQIVFASSGRVESFTTREPPPTIEGESE